MTDAVPSTAHELTRVLREAGTLRNGEVASVEITKHVETSVSHLRFIDVTYAAIADDLPPRLLVKWPLERSSAPERAESEFYRSMAPEFHSPPIVRCLATAPRDRDEDWVILEDLTATHGSPPWPEHPSDEALFAAISVLAQVHARWWDASGDMLTLGTPHTPASLREMVRGVAALLPAFMDELGDDVSSSDQLILEQVFSSSLAPWLRLADPHDLTIIHGDAHTWNFLFPRTGSGAPYLIDWQTWHRDVGARDLAYLMALHWDSRIRERLERPLLQHYHRELVRRGCREYQFDNLLLEYRRCVVRNLTFPIIYWSRGFRKEAWRYRLDCALAAYRELNAEELL